MSRIEGQEDAEPIWNRYDVDFHSAANRDLPGAFCGSVLQRFDGDRWVDVATSAARSTHGTSGPLRVLSKYSVGAGVAPVLRFAALLVM